MLLVGVELRAEMAGDTLHGYASVFGQVAKVPGGYEEIDEKAFDAVLARTGEGLADTIATRDHNRSQILGRLSAGTLKLGVDKRGLAFEVDLPDTTYARDLRVSVERGDITGASFAFKPGRSELVSAKDGRPLRRHTEIGVLADVAVVTDPAYDGAGVALRSFDWSAVPAITPYEQLLRLRMGRHKKGA